MNDNYVFEVKLPDFVETEYIKRVKDKAVAYLKAGIAINLSGPSGIGKTSLALYVARELGRPVVFIHGNEEMMGSDLIGGNYGYHKRKMVDNFVHNVYVMEEDMEHHWAEGRLTAACTKGYTLVYDEYTRSRPEVNNFLLSVLEERMLSLTGLQKKGQYLEVHPEFRVIFTSNPREYAGVHKSQLALDDRIITMDMQEMDRDTKIAVTLAQSGMEEAQAAQVVDYLQRIKEKIGVDGNISVRSCIKIARILQHTGESISHQDIYSDVLLSENRSLLSANRSKLTDLIAREIARGAEVESKSGLLAGADEGESTEQYFDENIDNAAPADKKNGSGLAD
jgi:gas vesicle protein GvpN